MINIRNSFAVSLYAVWLAPDDDAEPPAYRSQPIKNARGIVQVVSRTIGHGRVHFETPPSSQVPEEMRRYIQWFNDTAPGGKHAIRKAAMRPAITHLYFESIHPFEDASGRVGQALSEKALSQGLGQPALLSLSREIEARKKGRFQVPSATGE